MNEIRKGDIIRFDWRGEEVSALVKRVKVSGTITAEIVGSEQWVDVHPERVKG